MADTLVSNCKQMNYQIHKLLFTSAAIFTLRSETFQTTLVLCVELRVFVLFILFLTLSDHYPGRPSNYLLTRSYWTEGEQALRPYPRRLLLLLLLFM